MIGFCSKNHPHHVEERFRKKWIRRPWNQSRKPRHSLVPWSRETARRFSTAPQLPGSDTYNAAVNGRRNGVVHFPVELGKSITCQTRSTYAPTDLSEPSIPQASTGGSELKIHRGMQCHRQALAWQSFPGLVSRQGLVHAHDYSLFFTGWTERSRLHSSRTIVHARVLDVTDGRRVHDVSDDEPLDGFVFRYHDGRRFASHSFHLHVSFRDRSKYHWRNVVVHGQPTFAI